MTTDRISLDKHNTAAYKAQVKWAAEVREVAAQAGLERTLVELINIRCSQLNGCAFCLDTHTRMALKAGESTQRVAVLPAWREGELFTPAEKAALNLAEAVTLLPEHPPHEEALDRVHEHYEEDQVAAILWIVIAINSFNRLSVVSGHPVRPRSD